MSDIVKAGFQTQSVLVRTTDGEDDILQEPLVFWTADGRVLRAPAGTTTDGLSTPRIIRNLPGYDATGDDWYCGVLHDAAYRLFLEDWNGTEWVKVNYTREQCDDLMLEALEAQGVGFIRRHTIYRALRMFGQAAFDADREAAKHIFQDVTP